MAKYSDDCEHWLLPQFLTDDDDDLFDEFRNTAKRNGGRNTSKNFVGDSQYDFAYGFGDFGFGPQSDLSSPAEGSTETESDDDDYITELTRKFVHSTLQESAFAREKKKVWALSGSPQSTLCCALGGGCGCHRCSSLWNPNCPSHVPSPTGMNRNDAALDLLYAAAGEVARMRMMEGATGFQRNNNNGGLVGPPRKPSPISIPQRSATQNLAHLSYEQQLKAVQFEQLRQQQIMKQQMATGLWGCQGKFHLSQTQQMVLNKGRKHNAPLGAWPNLEESHRQQPASSGMRAVILGNPLSKKECAGTGVFLPRGIEATAEPRKKSATVLLPDRVVQALNLKLETMDAPAQPKYSGGVVPDCEAARYRNGVPMAQQRQSGRQLLVTRNKVQERQQLLSRNQVQEFQLPQEWTY